jgi:dTDP-glucose 4,6-dehydratase
VDFAMKNGARVLYASTSEIYGDPLEHPQKEGYFGNVNTVGTRSCYDEGKRFGEAYLSTAIRKGLRGGMVRIFNTYGPRMRLDDGRAVPEFFRAAVADRPVPICGDGNQTRSFCYVSDLVEGIFRLYESGHGEPVNIGNPHEITISEMADSIERLLNKPVKRNYLPARPDDPKQRCPDITRARRVLGGWEPKVGLEEGLRKTIEHFQAEMAKG